MWLLLVAAAAPPRAERDSLSRYLESLGPHDAALARRASAGLGADSLRAGLETVARWVRSAPPAPANPPEPSPESASWSEHKLLKQLSSKDPSERTLAIQEVGRRRSPAGLEALRQRLEGTPESIGLLEATTMMEALGAARDSLALPQLARYAAMPDPYIRAYAYHAMGQTGDPRALGILRPALFGPCGFAGGVSTMDAAVRAMSILGDARDVPMLTTVARNCFLSRSRALAAIGAISGPDSAIAAIPDALGPKPTLADIFQLANLGPQIQSAIAERRAIRRDLR